MKAKQEVIQEALRRLSEAGEDGVFFAGRKFTDPDELEAAMKEVYPDTAAPAAPDASAQVASVQARAEKESADLKKAHAAEIDKLKKAHAAELDKAGKGQAGEIDKLKKQLEEANAQIAALKKPAEPAQG